MLDCSAETLTPNKQRQCTDAQKVATTLQVYTVFQPSIICTACHSHATLMRTTRWYIQLIYLRRGAELAD